MLRRSTDRKLESFKLFPYIAWGLIILFIFFAYKLATNLNHTAKELGTKSSSLESKVKADTEDFKDINFEE